MALQDFGWLGLAKWTALATVGYLLYRQVFKTEPQPIQDLRNRLSNIEYRFWHLQKAVSNNSSGREALLAAWRDSYSYPDLRLRVAKMRLQMPGVSPEMSRLGRLWKVAQIDRIASFADVYGHNIDKTASLRNIEVTMSQYSNAVAASVEDWLPKSYIAGSKTAQIAAVKILLKELIYVVQELWKAREKAFLGHVGQERMKQGQEYLVRTLTTEFESLVKELEAEKAERARTPITPITPLIPITPPITPQPQHGAQPPTGDQRVSEPTPTVVSPTTQQTLQQTPTPIIDEEARLRRELYKSWLERYLPRIEAGRRRIPQIEAGRRGIQEIQSNRKQFEEAQESLVASNLLSPIFDQVIELFRTLPTETPVPTGQDVLNRFHSLFFILNDWKGAWHNPEKNRYTGDFVSLAITVHRIIGSAYREIIDSS